MPILDTPDVNIDGALIEDIKTQNKHTCGFVQTMEYTEMSEIDETTHTFYYLMVYKKRYDQSQKVLSVHVG